MEVSLMSSVSSTSPFTLQSCYYPGFRLWHSFLFVCFLPWFGDIHWYGLNFLLPCYIPDFHSELALSMWMYLPAPLSFLFWKEVRIFSQEPVPPSAIVICETALFSHAWFSICKVTVDFCPSCVISAWQFFHRIDLSQLSRLSSEPLLPFSWAPALWSSTSGPFWALPPLFNALYKNPSMNSHFSIEKAQPP